MKIKSEIQENHLIKLDVEVEPEVLERSKQRAAKNLAKRVKIPGFRPGKAPYNIIQKHIGDAAILENALDLLMDDIYPQIIEEADIKPYGPGSLENVVSLDPPQFEFTVPLAPKVTLGDYKKIRVDYEAKTVGQEDIDKVLDNLRDNQAVIETVTRKAKEGDMVYIKLSGEKIEEEPEGNKELFKERSFPVVIEKKDTDTAQEWPFPGFSRKLIGLAAEEEKIIEYKFNKDYEYEDLQNVKAKYTVVVEEVKSRTLPEVDDDFAKSVGEYETAEALIKEITESLEKNFLEESNAEFDSKVIDKLVEQAEIKFPPQMLEHEINHFVQDLEQRLSSQGLSMDLYLKSREMDEAGLREEISPSAQERLNRGLSLMEVAAQEEITLTSEEVEAKTQETLNEFRQMFPEEDIKKIASGESLQNLVSNIITDEVTKRTLERLRAIAKGEYKEETKKKTSKKPAKKAAEEKAETAKQEEKEEIVSESAEPDPVNSSEPADEKADE